MTWRVGNSSNYRCHGLTFASEIVLEGADLAASGAADVTIRIGRGSKRPDKPLCSGAFFESTRDSYQLDVPTIARYCVHDGTTIEVEPYGEARSVQHFLLGSPMAALLLQRGMLVVQGSAVATSSGAVILAGQTASGKSALAGAFYRAGWSLLTDDVCAVGLNPVAVNSGPGFLCLSRRDVDDFKFADVAVELRSNADRFVVPVPSAQRGAVPLHAVCFLDSWNEEFTRVAPLTGAARSAALLSSLYHRPVAEACFPPMERLRQVSALAQVPCYKVWRPRATRSIQATMDEICTALSL